MPSTPSIDRVRTRALELGVYLPLGAAVRARDEIVDFDAKKVRKMVDGLIERGRGRVAPVERVVRRRADEAADNVEATAKRVQKTARKTAKQASGAAKANSPRLPRVAVPKAASDLPIDGYNSLTASEVVARLRGLTQTELARVYKYERANEGRTTILETIESRLMDLPIAMYDTMTVEEINDRLAGLDESELKAVRRYESETKNRSTVLEKVDSLLS